MNVQFGQKVARKRRVGVFVEGLDGAGKSHLVKEIYQQLIFQSAKNDAIPKVGWIKFPTFLNEQTSPIRRDMAFLKDMMKNFEENYSLQDCEILICDRGPITTFAHSKDTAPFWLADAGAHIFRSYFDVVLVVFVPISAENALKVIERRNDPRDNIPTDSIALEEWRASALNYLERADWAFSYIDKNIEGDLSPGERRFYSEDVYAYEATDWRNVDEDVYEQRAEDAMEIVDFILKVVGAD